MARFTQGREAKNVKITAFLYSILSLFVIDSVYCPASIYAAALKDLSLKSASLVRDKQKTANDKLTASGSFRLGAGHNDANPATEAVTFTVGSFTQTIPANTFTQKVGSKKTTWTFKGAKGGLTRLTLVKEGEEWTFTAIATNLTLPLSPASNPLSVAIQIGDDNGLVNLYFAIKDSVKKTLFKFPSGKTDDADGDGKTEKEGDCDDSDPMVYAGALELCDGVDNNCDRTVDEGFDNGIGCTVGVGACQRDGVKICAPDENGTVCNASPGTPTAEVCNSIDDNCDGQVDEGLGEVSCGTGPCARTVAACVSGQPQTCTPGTPGTEICQNGIDEDCNGSDLACPPLTISITSPQNLALFNQAQQAVAGTADPTAVAVSCNDRPMNLSAGNFTGALTLHEGSTLITCVATDGEGHIGTASISVTLDTAPPRVTITAPSNGATLTATPVTVTGMINDIVVGTVNELEALVTCNGRSGRVANRAFIVTDVPLEPGANTLTCTAQDRAENVDSARISVTLDTTVAKQIAIVSGNTQTGRIGALLPQPLVVQLSENGAPTVGKVVLFKVLENDGVLSADANNGRMVAVTTNSEGRAQVHFTLGTWAGAGNNRVQALATGFVGEALFSLSALPGDANLIVVDAGNLQTGVVGQPLPKPFIVAVIDQGNNRLGGVPVTFTVEQGGGNFDGQSELTVNTDSDGRAQAVLTLGLDEGFDNNLVSAAFPGNPGTAATFMASGKVAGDPQQTKISGVVLDNTNQPVPGVTLYIEGSPLTTQANDQGQFVLQPAPVGHVMLVADGTTATPRDGRPWPTLEYELVTIAGRDNTIGMPIFLLPIDTPNGLLVDETTGGTLTLADVPGFSLTIVPGSATFPDGSKRGTVSVTMVHPDKVPMVPNFGQQPQFIVTIQPAGVHFNPPAAMTIPNADGFAPGQKTEMYSFDHDLGSFVSIGPGTVSDDGMVIASDPGVGVIKGGWHCGGNPTGIGTCEHECDDGNDCTEDSRVDGVCITINRPNGTPCKTAKSVQVDCRPNEFFFSSRVNVAIDDSCSRGTCNEGECRPAGVFDGQAIASAATAAVDTICHNPCIVGEGLRDKMTECLAVTGFRIRCGPLETPTACGEATTFFPLCIPGVAGCSNVFTLGPKQFTSPGCMTSPLSSTIFHEMVHSASCDAGGPGHGDGDAVLRPTDKVFGCEESCFPGSTGGRGFPLACQ